MNKKFTSSLREQMDSTTLNLYDLIFPHSAPSFCNIIAAFCQSTKKQAICLVITEEIENVNLKTLTNTRAGQ